MTTSYFISGLDPLEKDRCSNSQVELKNGTILWCENTVEGIRNDLNRYGWVLLDLTDECILRIYSKDTIKSVSYAD